MAITRSAGDFGWLGPVLYMVAYPLGTLFLSNYLFKLGYRSGLDSIGKFMESENLLITEALTILGLVVVGALTASFVSVPFPVQIKSIEGETYLLTLTLINSIFPQVIIFTSCFNTRCFIVFSG